MFLSYHRSPSYLIICYTLSYLIILCPTKEKILTCNHLESTILNQLIKFLESPMMFEKLEFSVSYLFTRKAHGMCYNYSNKDLFMITEIEITAL